MSASQTASALLLTLISTVALFLIFAGVTSLSVLAKHSYALDYGWQTPKAAAPIGECDRALTVKGFPLTTRRPSTDPSGCLDETNTLAREMNLALCFAAAAIISVGAVGVMRNR